MPFPNSPLTPLVLAVAAAAPLQAATPTTHPTDVEHRFEYRPDAKAVPSRTVHVAGTFNGWSTSVTPMRQDDDGVWRAIVHLPEGVYHYKFVLDGRTWVTDPNSDKSLELPDNVGAKNSAVLVGPDARTLPATRPAAINASALIHRPADPRDFNVISPGRIRLALRAQSTDVSEAAAYIRNTGDWQRIPLTNLGPTHGFDRFAATISLDRATNSDRLQYLFELKDGPATIYFAGGQSHAALAAAQQAAYSSKLTVTFPTPDWAKHAVWYQIFPERFRNGDPSNDPPNAPSWTAKWSDRQPNEDADLYRAIFRRRYGGDIQGIRERLPYLRSLGINAIYLNPIFEAESQHKYDTSDFRHIDDNFGVRGDLADLKAETDDPATWQWSKSDRLFLDLVADAHKQGFKVIIDGVFNHVGRKHYAFQDLLKNGRDSRYVDWFEVTGWEPRLQYKGWDGPNGGLPVFKKDAQHGLAEGPRQHILAIARRWLAPDGDPSRGVDGFRLDVAGDIPHPFWAEFRNTVKSINPDALIIGELWAPAQPFLRGDEFDGVMNYPFATASKSFFAANKKPLAPSEYAKKLSEIADLYPLQSNLVLQNLFDSHDTDRWASMFVNGDIPYDTAGWRTAAWHNYNFSKPLPSDWLRLKQSAVLQMTYLGAPMIYYGTEAGMYSGDDPDNRQPMLWADLKFDDPALKFDQDLFTHYQRLIALRHTLPALREGTFHPLLTDDENEILVFTRELDGQRVYVVLNRSAEERTVKLPLAAADRGKVLFNFLDATQTELLRGANDEPNTRPALRARQGAGIGHLISSDTLEFRLPAYGSGVFCRNP